MNVAPAGFAIRRDLPPGFAEFYWPLHRRFTREQQRLVHGAQGAARARARRRPADYPPPSEATQSAWAVELPAWCADQRNQMTGPADEAELCVKMLNSGAPGVMLDLEDSMANTWEHLMLGHRNIVAALYGELTYEDAKRGGTVAHRAERHGRVEPRARTASLAGAAFSSTSSPAHRSSTSRCSSFDSTTSGCATRSASTSPSRNPPRRRCGGTTLFDALIEAKGWPRDSIKAMALVESHPIAYEIEEFLFNLREYIVGPQPRAAGTTWRA